MTEDQNRKVSKEDFRKSREGTKTFLLDSGLEVTVRVPTAFNLRSTAGPLPAMESLPEDEQRWQSERRLLAAILVDPTPEEVPPECYLPQEVRQIINEGLDLAKIPRGEEGGASPFPVTDSPQASPET